MTTLVLLGSSPPQIVLKFQHRLRRRLSLLIEKLKKKKKKKKKFKTHIRIVDETLWLIVTSKADIQIVKKALPVYSKILD
jgi:hypothetical protein